MARNNGPRRLAIDEFILGTIGIGGFAVFVIALAVSIGSVVFGIIISIVLIMALVDYYEGIWRTNGDILAAIATRTRVLLS